MVTALADPKFEIARAKECNIFAAGSPVQFAASLRGFPAGAGEATALVTNYFGDKRSLTFPLQIMAGKTSSLSVDLGALEPGYYDLNLTAKLKTAAGQDVAGQAAPMSFGVAQLVNRSAQEVRDGGYRFGLKMFVIGKEGVWWNRAVTWNVAEVVGASTKLGFQWTRHQFNQPNSDVPGEIGTSDLITKHPMNVVLKIEGFPEQCYDAARYGPLEEWKAKHKGKSFGRNTVPMKEPYQAWLKDEVAKIPAEQNIFEMGNEVWNYMPAEEFAEWCRITSPALRAARPQARLGADPGSNEYSKKFVAAGGMDGMEIWYTHPYCFTPLPEHRVQGFLRNKRDLLRLRTGKDYDLYVTEYGWSTAPQDRRGQSVSERLQAQRTTRESLMLYAEDARAIIPHWMGDREQDPTEREHFFGFFHINQQPKPVVLAHAVCARMIDGSRYVGDLWYGPGIGAMLFDRSGAYTLALWTAEEDKPADVNVGVPEVKLVDIMGREKFVKATNGKVSLALTGDVTYLTGVAPSLAASAVPPGQDLNPDRWSIRSGSIAMPRSAGSPKIDGALGEWTGQAPVALTNPKAGSADGQAAVMLRYDAEFVYAAARISDDAITSRDKMEINLGTRPARQPDMGGVMIYDYNFAMTPPAGDAKAVLVVKNDALDQPLEVKADQDPSGIRWAIQAAPGGWTAELAIPIKFLKGFPEPKTGAKISGRFVFTHKDKATLSFGADKPRLWPYISLLP